MARLSDGCQLNTVQIIAAATAEHEVGLYVNSLLLMLWACAAW